MGSKTAARRIVSLLTISAIGVLATAGLAGAAPAPPVKGPGEARMALKSCQALLDGTVPAKQVTATERSCAMACGQLTDAKRFSNRPAEEQAVIDEARALCLSSCSVIFDNLESLNGSKPVMLAVEACWVAILADSDTLPTTDNGGRTWR